MFAYLWNKLAYGHNPGKLRSQQRKARTRRLAVCGVAPCLEILEDRCLLTSSISEFPVTPGSFPFGITAGPDGNIWFTQMYSNQIGKLDPVMHVVSEYTIPP